MKGGSGTEMPVVIGEEQPGSTHGKGDGACIFARKCICRLNSKQEGQNGEKRQPTQQGMIDCSGIGKERPAIKIL